MNKMNNKADFWVQIFSEIISDFARLNPDLTKSEIKQRLYFSPETEAGQIWNGLVLKIVK